MTVQLIAFFIIAAQTPTGHPYNNRIEFFRLAHEVTDGWTQTQVRELLGPPDDVLTPADKLKPNPDECLVWCYGSVGHGSFPTLGRIEFSDRGEVTMAEFWQKTNPPAMSIISDQEMDLHLRRLFDAEADDGQARWADVLFVIRAYNDLRRLTKEKALAVMIEFSRVEQQWMSARLFLLRSALFSWKPSSPSLRQPYFPMEGPGRFELSKWTDFPIIESGGIPFYVPFGGVMEGFPEPFEDYARHCQSDWILRKGSLRPANDPFRAFDAFSRSPRWDLFSWDAEGKPTEEQRRMWVLPELLYLVRDAWQPKGVSDTVNWRTHPPFTFDQLHAEFLAARVHWDAKRQDYVSGR